MTGFAGPDEVPEVRLKDLRAGLPPVHVLGRVVALSKREVTGKNDGRRRTILSGLLTDGTATVRFTWWDPPAEGVDPGTVLRAVNAQVREFRERPELSFGWSTRIQPASDLELPSVRAADLPLRRVAELEPGSEGFRLEVRVLNVALRTVTVREERRSVHSGVISDSSGSIPFTAWVDFRLHAGETVRITGVSVRRFRDSIEVALDQRSAVEKIPAELVPPARPTESVSIDGLGSPGGVSEAQIEGWVMGLGSRSGVVARCPTCRRILDAGVCPHHGAVTGILDLRILAFLDDGKGVAAVDLSRELAEPLTGRSLDQWVERPRIDPNDPAVERELRRLLVGQRLRVRGRVRVDEFGTSMFPFSCEKISTPPEPAVDALARRLSEQAR
jgi:ssDNA-binding replication factor A large subunit